MSMEMTVQPLNLAAVVFNKAEMAAAIAAINDRYKGLVVTDKAEAKKDRAEVNRLLGQIDDVRKAIKKQYEAPLKAFEADVKEVVEPLKASRDAIDEQIKRIEEQERNQRKAVIEAVYADMKPSVPLSRVLDSRWYNLSTSEMKAVDGLTEAINAAEADLHVIRSLTCPNTAALIDRYNEGATLAEVMEYKAKLEQVSVVCGDEVRTDGVIVDAQPQTFAIDGTETPAEIIAQLEQENPKNQYTLTETGILVQGKPTPHKLMISCTDGQYAEVLALLDRLGCFYVEG